MSNFFKKVFGSTYVPTLKIICNILVTDQKIKTCDK